jgi:hypothetical protein
MPLLKNSWKKNGKEETEEKRKNVLISVPKNHFPAI